MFRYAMIALVGVLSAVTTAKAVVTLDEARRSPPRYERPIAAVARIARAEDGHYWATGEVGGQTVRFLVDTGATAVSLTPADARKLGFDPRALTYDYEVITAQGRARAASVRLDKLSVDGATVADVDALVIEKGLETSLLGMSYLGRLSRFEASPTALVLQP
jgi:aspartyl protease family protein